MCCNKTAWHMLTHQLMFRRVFTGLSLLLLLATSSREGRVLSAELAALVNQPPVIVSIEPPPGTVSVLSSITVQFDKPVTGIQADDLWINGAPAESVEGAGAAYTWRFDQPSFGLVQVFWEDTHQIRDLNDPPNFFETSSSDPAWEYELINLAAPSVAGLHPPASITLRKLRELEVTFNKPVRGVDASDLLVNGVPASSLTALDAGRYLFGFPEPAPGTVWLSWAANHGITDRLDPPAAFAGNNWSYTLDPGLDYSGIRINEILASNRHGILDEEGDAEDWIELYNAGSTTLDLEGWSLTDEADGPGQWTFPAMVIQPGEHLVVFASGKDRRSESGSLHTNFRLSVAGEYLGLHSADAPRLPVYELAPEFPEQRTDYSYGLNPAGQWRYFAAPTPGAPNGDSNIHEVAEEPEFSVQRGLFDAPFELRLETGTAGGTIRYTLDGSEPTSSTGAVYTSPLQITRTMAVRAAVFKPAALPSRPVTHTYIFPARVLEQPSGPPGFPATWGNASNFPDNIVPAYYQVNPEIVNHPAYAPHAENALRSLPSVSLVTDVNDLFGAQRGIYSHTAESQTLYRGPAWERACSIEFIPSPGEDGFQINCGVRIHGNASRNPAKIPKHSFRLFFRRDHGPSRLEYPVFPESLAWSFNSLVMRADFNNSWLHWAPSQRQRGTRIRDGWAKETWRDMGHAGSHTRYFHLYLNGLYWGIYDFGERIDAAFAANHYGGERTDYDAMASKPTQAIDGDQVAYNAMITAVRFRNMTLLANYVAAHQHLDMVNYIDYMLLNFYGGNEDWGFDSNWNAVRRREPGGTYRYIPWDCEQLLANLNYNRVNNSSVPSGLHTNLVRSPEYRLAFADRVQKHLFQDGALTVPAVTERWLKHANILDQAAIAESARWGAYRRDIHRYQTAPYELYTRDNHWRTEIDRITFNYFPQRHGIFLQQLRNAGLYPGIDAPRFTPHGGAVRDGTPVGIMSPSSAVYYTLDGSDPRVFGTGAIATNAITSSVASLVNVALGSVWRYWDQGPPPAANWNNPEFNDTAWPSGAAPLGYGNGNEATVIRFGPNSQNRYPAYYFRRTFTITNSAPVSHLTVDLVRDDGAVVYLNGAELLRDNMPPGTISYSTLASSAITGAAEETPVRFMVPADLLVNGNNLLAVEVHQSSVTSTDLRFDLGLSLHASAELVLHSNTVIKARAWDNGQWSALAEATFEVNAPAAYPLAGSGPYHFQQWNENEPAGTYPPHMRFYQTAVADPVLAMELDSLWTLPYNLTSRSRVNGLSTDGFAFRNTANPQEIEGAGFLGAAVLALDTSGTDDIRVTWTGGTVAPNTRAYGIRLQYRIGDQGPFADVVDANGSPVEYIRNSQAGHSQIIGPVQLPDAANNQPLVELRWKYHYISGDSGPRAQLRVAAIQVTVGAPAAQSFGFVEVPQTAQAGWPLGAVIVEAQGENGVRAADYNGLIELSIEGNPGALSGVLTRLATGGVAVFDGLVFNQFGAQSLTASATGLLSAVSEPIAVVGLTETILPRFIQGEQPENNQRVPFAFRLSLAGLKPNATYRYGNRVVLSTDPPAQDGAGNMIFVTNDGTDFIRNTDSPRFRDGDRNVRHSEFTTDLEGGYSGWFITEPSGNPRFAPGNHLHIRLLLNDGGTGEEEFHSLTTPSSVQVITFGQGPAQATALYGQDAASPKNFVLLYQDEPGIDRPLTATFIEAGGVEVDERYAAFYVDLVAGRDGRWGTLVPNQLPNGVRRIEERSMSGNVVAARTFASGIPGTANATGGLAVSGGLPPERALVIEGAGRTATGFELFIRGGYPGLSWQAGRSLDLIEWDWLWQGAITNDSGWTVRDESEERDAAFYQLRVSPGN
jgi:hypothetical protein